jgi:hypothetical protein
MMLVSGKYSAQNAINILPVDNLPSDAEKKMNAPRRSNKIELNLFYARRKLRNMFFIFTLMYLPMSGCAETKPEPLAMPVKQQSKPPLLKKTASALQEKISFEQKYALEIAMSADCPKEPMSSGWHGVISDGACKGRLPSYYAAFMETLSTESSIHLHNATNQQLFKSTDNRFYFRTVSGFGQRPDILVNLADDAWVRSFEGADPTITMYLVRARFACNANELRVAKENGRFAIELCEDPGARFYQSREDDPTLRLRLFRVQNEGAPEDVTATLLPPMPSMTMAERKRYYKYGVVGVDDQGRPTLPDDTHLLMQTNVLQYAPTLRWWLPLDPDLPIPKSDPRGPGIQAHFGFLTWNGKRFQMQQRVPRSFVPCGVLDSGTVNKCIPGTDPYAQKDPFIIELG